MTDTVIESFRTAVGGFHKGDVTKYIARTAAEFDQKLKEKEAENIDLREKNEELMSQLAMLKNHSGDASLQASQLRRENLDLKAVHTALQKQYASLQEQHTALQEQYASLQEQNAALQEQYASLQEQNAALQNEQSVLQQQNAEIPKPAAAEPAITDLELAAYRRAEAVERIAVERAKRISGSMETLFNAAAQNYQGTDAQIRIVMETLTEQIDAIQEICNQLDQKRGTVLQQLEDICGREFFTDPKEEN